MAVFKCKMCGGNLNIEEGSTTCECEYCGTTQTIPALDDEKKANLFSRANRLRFSSEFDAAAGVFESIVSEFPEEAEAYWGLCLCKYGIEYVDDPATAKKIPTCHRTSFESIFDDNNFEQACENADAIARRLYREEAKEIDRIQKSILDIAKNEAPYDIFICYKETAPDGERTKDSVLAQDMYDALTEKGYKVFFARITLEDKLGQEYEPYIFSALNSAKIMLAVGTDYEYFNAVWVKNEWSRFLDMMKRDKSKTLIPCYADIDAYDMPKEFRNLQGQDMGKVGFLQDLVRGIGKILRPVEDKPEATAQTGANALEPLLERAFMFLEDADWDKADEYFEKVLDSDPKNAEAYFGKLLAEYKVKTKEHLGQIGVMFDKSENYKKVIRFGSDLIKKEVFDYLSQAAAPVLDNIEEKVSSAKTEDEFDEIIRMLDSDFSDTIKQMFSARIADIRKAVLYRKLVCLTAQNFEQGVYDRLLAESQEIIGYKDAQQILQDYYESRNSLPTLYEQKKEIMEKLRFAEGETRKKLVEELNIINTRLLDINNCQN